MYLKELEITGFKSFAKKSNLKFNAPISAIVGPNGSGKSNIAEAFRFALGEQSFKSMRGKKGEDLIFNGTPQTPRSHKASVKVVLDNSAKKLPIDFEEVALERVVHKDGVNEYLINGSPVRLRDIIELLAAANIGSSGHHIISQGEADRILNASPKERKSFLEEALGLKIFQYKKTESERKLLKTDENIKQVESLRREISPHIKFLKKQVEKIEEGKKLKSELLIVYKDYLARESVYLENYQAELSKNLNAPRKRLAEIESEIKNSEETAKNQGQNQSQNQSAAEIKELEGQISKITSEKEELLREEGRIDGQIFSLTKLVERQELKENLVSIKQEELNDLRAQINSLNSEAESISDVDSLRALIKKIMDLVKNFLGSKILEDESASEIKSDIEKHKNRQIEIQNLLAQIAQRESGLREKISTLRQKLDEDKSISLEAEKKIILLMSEKNEIQEEISKHVVAIDTLNRDEEAFKQELTEAVVLAGREVLEYEKEKTAVHAEIIAEISTEKRELQLDRRKKLERLKIKVEEIGAGSGDDVVREFKEATERDEFLLREIEDLEKSSAALQILIDELGQKIETKFHEGVSKINKEFQDFFALMFGGGTASVRIIKTEPRRRRDTDLILAGGLDNVGEIGDIDDMDSDVDGQSAEEAEEGIEIKVSLPRKKISGLMMLSGGERALTSIALLFAISQVNPPPFIILDETDAALDEANSRKYGDMIENLSKNSQLILITHNRETMGRAGVLYGVTMQGGVSQLLSVAFEEGAQWAKS